jgi:hypothetical protein
MAGGVTQVVACLPSKCEALISKLPPAKKTAFPDYENTTNRTFNFVVLLCIGLQFTNSGP